MVPMAEPQPAPRRQRRQRTEGARVDPGVAESPPDRATADQQRADRVVEDPDLRAAGAGLPERDRELQAGLVVGHDEVLEADAAPGCADAGEHGGKGEAPVPEHPDRVAIAQRRRRDLGQLEEREG